MILPVKTVIKTAVLLGLKLKMLKRAFPTLVPKRSPNVESIPPRTNSEIISSQPFTERKRRKSYHLNISM